MWVESPDTSVTPWAPGPELYRGIGRAPFSWEGKWADVSKRKVSRFTSRKIKYEICTICVFSFQYRTHILYILYLFEQTQFPPGINKSKVFLILILLTRDEMCWENSLLQLFLFKTIPTNRIVHFLLPYYIFSWHILYRIMHFSLLMSSLLVLSLYIYTMSLLLLNNPWAVTE